MKQFTLFAAAFLAVLPGWSQLVGGAWTQKASVSAPGRFWAMAFSVNGKGYGGTGRQGFSGSRIGDFWEYDPATDTWAQKADVPGGAREGMDGFAIGNRGYAAFGTPFIAFSTDVFEYNPTDNMWTSKTPHPGIGFAFSHGFVIDSLYYIGPENGTNKFYAFNPVSNTWSEKAPFPGDDRRGQVAFAAAGKGYLGGGLFVFGGVRRDFWEYDPVANAWRQGPDFPQATDQSTGFGIGNLGFVYNVGGNNKDTYRYTPATDSWALEEGSTTNRIANASSFVIGNKGYLVFGEQTISGGSPPSNELWEFTPGVVSRLAPASIGEAEVNAAICEGMLFLDVKAHSSKALLVSLRDVAGKLAGEWSYFASQRLNATEPLPQLSGGIYLLSIRVPGEQPLTRKLFVSE